MPPHVPRKRLREDSPDRSEGKPKKKSKAPAAAPPRKATLFDDLDAAASPKTKGKACQRLVESSDDSSSLTSLSDADFEDVPAAKSTGRPPKVEEDDQAEEDEDDEDIEFEDVSYSTTLAPQEATGLKDGALELTLSHIPTASYTDFGGKRGPSKNERRIRAATHCMHVQFLMWHNALRNTWLCDPTVQGIMLSHLPPGMWDEIERFRRNSGLEAPDVPTKKLTKGGSKGKTKGKSKTAAAKASRRDWGAAAERLEKGAVDLSFGDPLFRLLKALSNWWRKRFRITAPGVRKIGYMQTRRSTSLIKGYRAGGTNPKRYGERISGLDWFQLRAQECAGSRDVGAQLFTALLRAIGLEARMIANLQPVGFGFNKLEDAEPEKQDEDINKPRKHLEDRLSGQQSHQPGRSLRQKGRASLKDGPDDAQDDDLDLSDSDDDSIIEIPPLKPPKNTTTAKFDKDLEYPHYWTEVLSPATQKYVPVDAIVKNVIGTNRELTESFEPRGAKADKAKQVMAYVVGFSDDGTAKDVTVRYLKQQIFPGRTKGMRLPIEKVPVYNKNGKVKRYDQFDWFKSVLRGYVRGGEKQPLTDIDWDEELTDLKAAQPQQKEVKDGEETLQYYKQSKDFVLARHLKREEALLPTAKPVKVFKNKGKKGKGEEEPVYLRKDIVQVKSEETWHKQGRAPLPGVEPLKMAPYRVATTNRRRELAEAEALAGHKVLQPLYSYDQTDWIIPPPIENGVIPKNQYGNIDLFAEHMLPEGAAHVPYRGAVRVCKRLEIDFAEAVVDFEFGHRMAVPVIHGVVIPEEHYDSVMEELAKDEAEKKRKEDEKRRKLVLTTWKRFLMGLRIRERIRREYGDADGSYNVFGHSRDQPEEQNEQVNGEEMAGGFLPEGFEEPDEGDHGAVKESSFFFPANDDDDDDDEDDADDGHLIELGTKCDS
ncbi:Rad4-domain-containing protein [Cryphonectria parasitica EP155]|uniref:Rad4-domain-containing protein n=1 Tax=Cryphonectria parasitica (strain ATCC 38755 / EP155) TaxID=660469 RepID=A0A9P5CQX0_CRYP1|nr:Rad4-domain-containing protein [Cryphonectria parasitica EP155]KAF3767643.1 Rad4-domain-containing protein [Cryphonectria parasitica EP155]